MKRHLWKAKSVLILSMLCAAIGLTGCSIDELTGHASQTSIEEKLLDNIPTINSSAFNRFAFTMDFVSGNANGDGVEFNTSGMLEARADVLHMYNLDISFDKSGYKTEAETWNKYGSDVYYVDLGNGWQTGTIAGEGGEAVSVLEAIDLVGAINSRNEEMTLSNTGSAYILSWTFPTNDTQIFGSILGRHTNDMDLYGYGRITAVFDPETYDFQYFTLVISTSNNERAGAILDAMFYWDVVNSSTDDLQIPDEVVCSAYKASTGITTNSGYDEIVNPLAESFASAYDGITEISHHDDGSVMFWTLAGEETSATVNYMKTDDQSALYDGSYSFLLNFYGSTAEDNENEAYFYNPVTGELVYISKGDGWYAEIIITGEPGTTQGNLRKSLITYKAKLGI